jgi:carboxylesterase
MNLHDPYAGYGARPQFRRGGPLGCLCIHGFSAAPTEISWLADHLHSTLNLTTYTPRLAFHGTDYRDMHRARWQDWYMTVRDGYQLLADQCEAVFIAGISMGGLLSLMLSAADDVEPLATAVIAAPTAFKDPDIEKVPYLRHIRRETPVLDRSTLPQIVREEQYRRGEPVEGRTHYSTWSLNAIYEMYTLAGTARTMLYNIRVPLVLVYAEQDTAVPLSSADEIAAKVRSEIVEKHILHRSGHIITQDIEREDAFRHVESFFRRFTPHADRE